VAVAAAAAAAGAEAQGVVPPPAVWGDRKEL